MELRPDAFDLVSNRGMLRTLQERSQTLDPTQFPCGLQSGCDSLKHHTCAIAEYRQAVQIARNPNQIAQLLPSAILAVVIQSLLVA
jgi:hypothetical protein